ncbi:hypothetical protein [Marinobacterium stanieri]|uniref:hypothetical protein n=1 Tax=Marinobacterium stanieri TaxID=49186 RepID=UPI003A940248
MRQRIHGDAAANRRQIEYQERNRKVIKLMLNLFEIGTVNQCKLMMITLATQFENPVRCFGTG